METKTLNFELRNESQEIMPANPNRLSLVITNFAPTSIGFSKNPPPDKTVFLNFGAPAQVEMGIPLKPGNSWQGEYKGIITAITDQPPCPIQIMEASFS